MPIQATIIDTAAVAEPSTPADGSNRGEGGTRAGDLRKWLILATICVGYLMIILDLTVMNLA